MKHLLAPMFITSKCDMIRDSVLQAFASTQRIAHPHLLKKKVLLTEMAVRLTETTVHRMVIVGRTGKAEPLICSLLCLIHLPFH